MRIFRTEKSVTFMAEGGDSLRVVSDNRGEPYREGISLHVEYNGEYGPSIFLEEVEARALRDLLVKIL